MLISYYWPPAGGPGVQRVIKFLPHFRSFGYNPIILTVENPTSSAIDESLLKQIPHDILVYKTKTWEPFGLYHTLKGGKNKSIPKDVMSSKKKGLFQKLSIWARSNIFIPDARIGWKKFMIKKAEEIIEKHQIELIFSTAPPHSVHASVLQLKNNHKLPWVADFRDPWTDAYWLKDLNQSAFAKRKNSNLEKKVLQQADAITTVSEELIELFKGKAPNNYNVIHNGYKSLIRAEQKTEKTDFFTLLFIGNYTNSLDANTMIKALDKQDLKQSILLKIIGSASAEFVEKLRENHINFELNPYLPHGEMLEKSKSADALFLPLIEGLNYSKGIISSKTFDYLALQKPIIAIGPKNGIAERILNHTEAGFLVEFGDFEALQKKLLELMELKNSEKISKTNHSAALAEYSSENNVKNLCRIFDSLIKPN